MNNTCPQCGSQTRPGAKFCAACRAPLGQPAPDLPTASGPANPTPTPPAARGQGTANGGPPESATPAGGTIPVEAVPAEPPSAQGATPQLDSIAAPTIHLDAPIFASLPVGALLNDRHYEVTTVLSSGPKINAYLVVDRRQRRCGQCGSIENSIEDEYCADCGVALSAGPAIFWLRETLDNKLWPREKLMIDEKVRHPGLVNVYSIFEDVPYGEQTRCYLVSDVDEGALLSTLPHPQPEEKVLGWGQELAAAVGYLHTQGFRHRNLKGNSVRLVDDRVKLTNFGKAEKVAPAEDKDWREAEVADLARLLRDELLAGQALSSTTAAVLANALATDKNKRYATADAFAADLATACEAQQGTDSVAFVVGRRSHVGMVRDHNEDSLITAELQRVQLSESQPVGLYVVADGMGGHEAGEVASGIAITTVASALTQKLLLPSLGAATPANPGDLLKEAFQEANRAVHERGRKVRTDMGTTLVGALVIGNEAFIANIGDSRCYRLSGGELKQITTDHSLVARLVAAGQITPEDARVHPQRNYIYRTVGDKAQVEVDVFPVRLKPDDSLMLCSDGLSGMVEDPVIQETLRAEKNPQAACEKLVQLANAAGGDDNISVIVVQVVAANDNRK